LFTVWVFFHVLVSIGLVLVVLMQSAKGEGLAGGTAFGGGMSGAVFGGRGTASFLSRATTVLAVLFMVNCGALAFMSGKTRSFSSGAEGVTESAVTRKAQAEQEAAMERQLREAEAAAQDTLFQTTEPGTPAVRLVQPGEMPEPTGSEETPAGDAEETPSGSE